MVKALSSVQSLISVWLCNPMDCSMRGLPVHHQLPEFTQTHPLSRWCHPTISSSVRQFTHQTSLHRVPGQSVGEEEELVRMVTVSQFSWLFRGSDSWSRLLCPNHIKKIKNPSLHPVLDLSAFLYRWMAPSSTFHYTARSSLHSLGLLGRN